MSYKAELRQNTNTKYSLFSTDFALVVPWQLRLNINVFKSRQLKDTSDTEVPS